jgi:hypothetical protein
MTIPPFRLPPLRRSTRLAIARVFERLDYGRLGRIYCDAGGRAFWRARRATCERLGVRMARVLRTCLPPGGRSLYVGAGVAELPVLIMERLELQRTVAAFNLRPEEVRSLNRTLQALHVALSIQARSAATAAGRFDHLWIVSVLNDPERYPELSALAYGRATPTRFNVAKFQKERDQVARLADACLNKVTVPGLVTTSVEEIPWVTDWGTRRGRHCVVEKVYYPSAIVGDPICLIRIDLKR